MTKYENRNSRNIVNNINTCIKKLNYKILYTPD